jgi:hypothetical protein
VYCGGCWVGDRDQGWRTGEMAGKCGMRSCGCFVVVIRLVGTPTGWSPPVRKGWGRPTRGTTRIIKGPTGAQLFYFRFIAFACLFLSSIQFDSGIILMDRYNLCPTTFDNPIRGQPNLSRIRNVENVRWSRP